MPRDDLSPLRALLADKAEARGPTLGAQLARAARRLPRALRGDARVLADAETMARHPRMARLVDPRAVRAAERRVSRHLRTLDPLAARRRRRADHLALVGFYVFVVLAAGVALLAWRG